MRDIFYGGVIVSISHDRLCHCPLYIKYIEWSESPSKEGSNVRFEPAHSSFEECRRESIPYLPVLAGPSSSRTSLRCAAGNW